MGEWECMDSQLPSVRGYKVKRSLQRTSSRWGGELGYQVQSLTKNKKGLQELLDTVQGMDLS